MAGYGLQAHSALIIDPTSTNQNTAWQKWIKNLNCYFIAANIQCTKRQRALLLYCGGEDLRKIHETLNDTSETYKETHARLEAYFATRTNKTYERHVFRGIEQKGEESAKTFLVRLREQSARCDFDNYSEEQAVADQFVEKCSSQRLRRKLL